MTSNTIRQIIHSRLNALLVNTHDVAPKLLLGLSGGPDSVLLFHVLREYSEKTNITFDAAHINHQLRDTADEDEVFCQQLCQRHNIPLHKATLQELTALLPEHHRNNHSIEARGRSARRFFFEQIRRSNGYTHIVLGHHSDDQEENFFIRLIRGSTLDGLSGIKESDGTYIRPMLSLRKKDILMELQKNNYPFCLDETNANTLFLRNAIRSKILPHIHASDKRFHVTFSHTLKNLQEENEYIELCTAVAYDNIMQNGTGNLTAWQSYHPVIQRRFLIRFLVQHNVPFTPSKGLLEEIRSFLNSPRGGSHTIASGVCILKKQQKFSIASDSLLSKE